MRRPRSSPQLLTLAVLATAASAGAQTDRATRFMDNCRRDNGDEERFCETRTLTVAAGKALSVDGRTNGGISVHGWDRADIQVLAMIQANAEQRSGSARHRERRQRPHERRARFAPRVRAPAAASRGR